MPNENSNVPVVAENIPAPVLNSETATPAPVLETPTPEAAPTTPALPSRDEATRSSSYSEAGTQGGWGKATPSPEAPAPEILPPQSPSTAPMTKTPMLETLSPATPASDIPSSAPPPVMPNETPSPPVTELPPAVEVRQTQPATPSPILKPAAENQNIISQLLNKARLKIKARKEARLNKILSVLAEKGRLSSHEICRLIKKSRITVFRSMNQLEQLGKVRQIGKRGKAVYYELVK